jgi:N-acyl-D-amino-acid deacylase
MLGYDVVIRRGSIVDGSGATPFIGDVAIHNDAIAAVAPSLEDARGAIEIDAAGLAVAPGFINMLSWATESLIEDGASQSDIRQGVTLEIFGEGRSMGPLNPEMKREALDRQSDIRYPIEWTTLGEYLDYLVERGVACNVASFVGATSVRVHEVGYADRPPTSDELERMCNLVRQAMREGALGVGSSLIYAPAFYAGTDELVALTRAAAEYGGMYISHIRSEANHLLESIDELVDIARRSGAPAEIYHLKASGAVNWPKLESAIARIEAARAAGLSISADMYTYTAGSTGLSATMPPWVQEGGHRQWIERLKDPAIRARVIREMRTPTDTWENMFLLPGSPENILLVGFKSDALKPLTGRTVAEVATERGTPPEETILDLVIEDDSRVGAVFHMMSEDNVRREIGLPWVSFGSDAGSLAPEGAFLRSSTHPRAYGNVARLLGRYVRDERLIPLQEAVRRLAALPAENLKLDRRGRLAPGFFADVVIFDPATIRDKASYAEPHQYAEGVEHVLVNGVQVLKNGEHTGARPGRVVRGPSYATPTGAVPSSSASLRSSQSWSVRPS